MSKINNHHEFYFSFPLYKSEEKEEGKELIQMTKTESEFNCRERVQK